MYTHNNLLGDAKVGNFNTGYAQYYTPSHDVVNLDGVINPDAYEALRAGWIDCYIVAENATHLVTFVGHAPNTIDNRELSSRRITLVEETITGTVLEGPKFC